MYLILNFCACIALLTSNKFAEWKQDDLLLINALQEEQMEARSVIWNSAENVWSDFEAVIVLSTWDYFEGQLDHFFETIHNIEKQGIPVFNCLETIQWNSSKVYLRTLEERGVKIVDSIFLSSQQLQNLPVLLTEKRWEECIIKPTISAGGHDTFRFNKSNLNEIQRYFANYSIDLIIQPFMQEIITEGEWSFVFFDGEFAHCVLKKPAAGKFLVQDIHGGSVTPVYPPSWMIEEAKKILDATGQSYLHARVDVIKKDSSLIVMEIEMIEPNLFLKFFEGSEKKLAKKIKERISLKLLNIFKPNCVSRETFLNCTNKKISI